MVGTPEEIKRHLGLLRRRDKRISHAIKFAGFPEPRVIGPGFATLIRIIGDQQVSTAAGAAIYAKLKRNAGGRVTAARLLGLGENGMRASGFSGQKTRYALGLAEAVDAGTLNLKALERADDDTVRATLTAFKGIGDWTADIYLMFGMGRHDVWPVGDLALQLAIQHLHELETRPTAKDLIVIGEMWRPYRSSASLLLWRYYGAARAVKKPKTN
ncbi:MAG: DNA-3-methyladenine glycosylase 2 family protein [Rhodospirillaceae bacterium]|nr:DNA-3-methyladenine glycosylase 2 family protein [Rhodospirillaceae bacterium]